MPRIERSTCIVYGNSSVPRLRTRLTLCQYCLANELAIAYQEQGKPDKWLHFARMAIKFAEKGSEQGTLTERSRWLVLLLTAQRIEAFGVHSCSS